jgi:hypothetical protein
MKFTTTDVLLSAILFFQILNFVYSRFIWNDLMDMWRWVMDPRSGEMRKEWQRDHGRGAPAATETQGMFRNDASKRDI